MMRLGHAIPGRTFNCAGVYCGLVIKPSIVALAISVVGLTAAARIPGGVIAGGIPSVQEGQRTTIRVRGRIPGYPADAPAGLFSIGINGDLQIVPIGPGGTFEFLNVRPGVVSLLPRFPSSRLLTLQNQDKDADNVELAGEVPLLGQVVLEDGAHMPTNRTPNLPVLRLEARSGGGSTIPHRFVRADGVFGFPPLPPGDYTFRLTLIPEGYAVKSMSYGGADALNRPVKLSISPYSFMRVTLSKTDVRTAASTPPAPGPSGIPPGLQQNSNRSATIVVQNASGTSPIQTPEIASTTASPGNATIIVSHGGRAEGSIEGFSMFFVVRNADGTIYEDGRFAGQSCNPDSRTLGRGQGNNPTALLICTAAFFPDDSMAFSVAPGEYYVASYLIFGMDAPDNFRTECWAAVTVVRGETARVERLDKGQACTMARRSSAGAIAPDQALPGSAAFPQD
jgi:hypothetical protein